MAAMAAISRFCSLVSFLISFPLTPRRGSSRDDSYGLFASLFEICVNDKKHRSRADRPESDPAIFLIGRFVPLRQSTRIIECQSSGLKAHIRWFSASSHSKRMADVRHCSQTNPRKLLCQYICMYIKASRETFAQDTKAGAGKLIASCPASGNLKLETGGLKLLYSFSKNSHAEQEI